MNEKDKRLFLKDVVKSESAIDELLTYTENKFIETTKNHSQVEDTYIETWEEYCKESKEIGVFKTLKKYLTQLQFPVEKGISKTEDYINTTLKGRQKQSESNLELNQPELISLEIYETTMAGKVPVIVIPNTNDFNTIICALSNKNEPEELPKSMGASFINGINNWHRIHKLKANYLKKNPFGNWNEEFKKNILPNPHLYKDKIIVLSTKNYSSVKSELFSISPNTWKEYSLKIRREHECAHLFTLKQYGCMANNMHDEIIADYAGITTVQRQFNKEWFLQFIGLEDYPIYRNGGRLQNYQGSTKLSPKAFDGLKTIVKRTTDTIFNFDTSLGAIASPEDKLNRIKSICEVDLITMASSEGVEKLVEKYNDKISPYHDKKERENID